MIPIKQLFKKINGITQPFYPLTHEEAVFDGGGRKLSEKLQTYEENLSDAFSEEKVYAVNDYVIYGNRLYKFAIAKEAGPFDGTKVVPCSICEEMHNIGKPVLLLDGNVTTSEVIYTINLSELSMSDFRFLYFTIRNNQRKLNMLDSKIVPVSVFFENVGIMIPLTFSNKNSSDFFQIHFKSTSEKNQIAIWVDDGDYGAFYYIEVFGIM